MRQAHGLGRRGQRRRDDLGADAGRVTERDGEPRDRFHPANLALLARAPGFVQA
jgi:hypothetical protein